METLRGLLKYFKEHVWGTVIGGVLVLIVGAVFGSEEIKQYLLMAWGYISNISAFIWNWILSTHEVYGWALIVLTLLALTAIALLALKAIDTYEIVRRERGKPDYLSYTQEPFYGVTWEWVWKETSEGQYRPGEPIAYCPECQSILDIDRHSWLEIKCINDNCSWKWNSHTYAPSEEVFIIYKAFEKKLTTEILRKIKADEYKAASVV